MITSLLTRSVSQGVTDSRTNLAVHCRGVTKHFGAGETRTTALSGVDFTVHPGEMTLLVGPSG
ncbi:MAG: hypothetical protein L0Y72_12220, partial [Gemmataceae bacterium]|nr:hypothetical protein [Gemmataceae bacterium]